MGQRRSRAEKERADYGIDSLPDPEYHPGVSNIVIGTSGYSYDHWSDGIFYPPRLARNKWLEYYSRYFGTVELNVTFYRLPQEKAFANWYERTPDSFRFAVKGSRFITHVKRLANLGDSVETLGRRIRLLREKCSVVLWQLPPGLKLDIDRLEDFCKLATATIDCRHTFEFRNETWLIGEVYEVLRRHGCALCLADWFERDMREPITADFTYIRRHGPSGRYLGNYTRDHLERDARDIVGWMRQGIDVYAYFNNDIHGHAVRNAQTLHKLVAKDTHKL